MVLLSQKQLIKKKVGKEGKVKDFSLPLNLYRAILGLLVVVAPYSHPQKLEQSQIINGFFRIISDSFPNLIIVSLDLAISS